MRVLIAGYGMAGARLAELLAERDAGMEITVAGAETRPAYNRVLLPRLLSGALAERDLRLHDDEWARRAGVTLRLGDEVSAVDRTARVARLAGGAPIPYDVLVLATGSRVVVPEIEGLLPNVPGVSVLRTVDDFLGVAEGVADGVPVAVLGGGVLGVEAALTLAGLDVPVTVVQPSGRLMERSLDEAGSAVLDGLCRRAGVSTVLGRGAVRVYPGDGVKLDDGTFVPAGLVVLAAGVRPETSLAERAGLAADSGILVDDRLRTADPRIHAIGDCARFGPVPAGLVAPAWAQAEVLAEVLTGGDVRYEPPPASTRLRVGPVDLTTVGDPCAPTGEVLRFEDPAGGRYARLAMDGDRVAGAILLGLPEAAAVVADVHASGRAAPADRLSLMFGRALPGSRAETGALVCRCNGVTRESLVKAWRAGAADAAALTAATRAGTGCGDCAGRIAALAETLRPKETTVEPAQDH
ncbi:FAD-dependent oxidoreductase [Phytomonospora sp. NPDC050363]|uniref:NAD(P)/FAD-dependent oxidoreductase n=1 Tax=Phytomonospora sp. NPDC050363 TaxID=3155642 RepID=UPI0033CE7AC4